MASRVATAFSRHGYVVAVAAIALSTVVFLPGRDVFAKSQWALLYLLVILLVASAAGAGPAILAAVLAFFTWNFFFLPPYHTLLVHESKDWLALAAFLVVGVIVGVQTGRMRERESRALARERETAVLNRLSAAIVSQTSTEHMAETCLKEVVEALGSASATLFMPHDGGLRSCWQAPADARVDSSVAAHAARVYRSATVASTGDETGGGGGLFAPVRTPSGVSGVLAVQPRTDGRPYSAGDARLVTSLSNLVGAFLERERLHGEANTAAAAREADRLKSSLLSSVSHELKTPLAALTATVSNLLESDVDWDEESVRDELRAIVADVARLNSSIGALLELSRLEAHAWEPRPELYELSDIVAAGIVSLPKRLRERVRLELPEESPVVDVDFEQMKRAVQNLLENALLHGGEDGDVTVGAREWHEGVRLWIEDQGPGVPPDEHEAVFEKFYRGRPSGERVVSGTGLGLAIAREIVHAHGGAITVEDVKPHGARFVIVLPAGPVDVRSPGEEES
jgi:two-component system sensor histidine kinase KdpD